MGFADHRYVFQQGVPGLKLTLIRGRPVNEDLAKSLEKVKVSHGIKASKAHFENARSD
jgi:hypothetical protein